MRIRFSIPIVRQFFKARSFFRSPVRFIARRLFRFSLNIGIFGLSFGLGGLRFSINLGILSFLFGGRKKKGGGGSKKSGGGSKKSGGGSKKSGGGKGPQGGSPTGSTPTGQSGSPRTGQTGGNPVGSEPGERLAGRMERGIAALRERLQRSRREEREERDRPEREKAERAQREKAEKAQREKTEREESEKAEKAQREKAERDESEKEEREKSTRGESEKAEKVHRPAESVVDVVQQTEFDINRPLPFQQRVLLEASAGTGKTFSLTSLVARYVAEENLKMDQLLMVTFTKAAASEMRERTRAKLGEALAALESGLTEDKVRPEDQWMRSIVTPDASVRGERISRLQDAISAIDSAMITTIHGFFQQALREVGLRSADTAASEITQGKNSIAKSTLRDELVRRFAAGPVDLMQALPDKTPNDLETALLEVIRGLDSNISAIAAPHVDDGSIAFSWTTFVNQIREQINVNRSISGTITFDDLITGLRDLLSPSNPLSVDVIENMRTRYRLVLIDEFQDTDDTQWDIFSKIFDVELIKQQQGSERTDTTFLAMIMVGDPKQAIYRFRGADISAYLKAVKDPNLLRFEMKRNYRSDRNLIVGLNRWFQGMPDENGKPSGFKFGDKNIAFIQVDAKKEAGSGLRINGNNAEARALQLRWIPTDVKPAPTVDVLRPRIAEDLANHVALLLNEGTIPGKVNGVDAQRPVLPGDISILVRTHGDAEPIVEALRGRGIPVVKSSIGSVAQSEALGQLRTLLSAMAMPNDSRRVKALALSWFVNFDVSEILDERKIVDLGQQCNEWAKNLQELGIVGFYQALRSDASVISQISKSIEAERRLTDLEHLAELIHRSSQGRKLPASSVLRHLDEISKVEDENDEMLRRIDSDAKAIQITTMHASKGLEYPIVLVPYPKAANKMGAEVFTHSGQRFVNAAKNVSWAVDGLNAVTRTTIATEEIEGDELRLMYVAFTRAKHQLVVWWTKSRGMDNSSLARLLFGDHEDITQPTKALDGDEARERLKRLEAVIGVDEDGEEIMQLVELKIDDTTLVPLKESGDDVVTGGKSAVFPRNAVQDWNWKRWSFSSLSSSLKHDSSDTHSGGSDEGDVEDQPVLNKAGSSGNGAYVGPGLFSMPAGAEFGTLVHEVLEKVNFTSPTLLNDLIGVIDSYDSETLRGVDVDALANGLLDALLTPLEPVIPGFRFADLDAANRLAEMDFHFSLPTNSASAVEIAQEAAADKDSMFSSYFEQLAQTWSSEYGRNISGLMTGSIDVLFRANVDGRFKYYVVDYKSNRLHSSGYVVDHDTYEVDSMKKEMEKHHYPLQALFYCVALHRFMTHRIPDYDIDRDLGGAGYLFLRGMVGVDTPIVDGVRNGVLAWRPSTQTILAVDAILGGDVL